MKDPEAANKPRLRDNEIKDGGDFKKVGMIVVKGVVKGVGESDCSGCCVERGWRIANSSSGTLPQVKDETPSWMKQVLL